MSAAASATGAPGSTATTLRPLLDGQTRLLVRERDAGWFRLAAPKRSGILSAVAALVDYVAAEPLHFVMVRRMMLGLKQRAEGTTLRDG